jgi:hypothetical protein
MEERNELLRSAYAIACRKGAETNWDALKKNLEKELLKQAGIVTESDMQSVSERMGIPKEQIILRATCTAKTYRMSQETLNEICDDALIGE